MASYKKFIVELASKYQDHTNQVVSDVIYGQNEVYKEAFTFLSDVKNGTKKELVGSK